VHIPAGLSLIMILGAAQGLFLAAILFTRRANSLANRILAVTMVSFSLFILTGAYYAREWFLSFPEAIGASEPLIYTFGPLLYLYTIALSRGETRFRKRWLLHFIPATLVALYLVPFFLRPPAYKIEYLRPILAGDIPLDLRIINALKYPHGFVYTFFTLVVVHRYGIRLKETRSSVERINLRWLRNLMYGGLVVWILSTIENTAPILMAVYIYAMGYLGIRQPGIFRPTFSPRKPSEGEGPAAPGEEPVSTRYRKSGLDSATADDYLHRLLQCMETEKPYIQNDLTLQELAGMLDMRPHNLSEIINTRLERSFYDFVNGYRVEEVKRRLADPALANYTILAIAFDAGFNSKSTFNEFFKRQVGETPSAYRRRVQAA